MFQNLQYSSSFTIVLFENRSRTKKRSKTNSTGETPAKIIYADTHTYL